MRELCHQALAEHNGLCRIGDDTHNIKTKTGYNSLVIRLFQQAGQSIEVTEYEIDSYEAAIPKADRI